MIIISKPGIYDLTNAEYHSSQAHSPITGKLERIMSKSALVKASRSWAHYKASCDFPMVPSPIMEFGTDAHTAVLEPEIWDKQKGAWFGTMKVKPKFSGKGSGDARKAWEAENSNKNIITTKEFLTKKAHFDKIDRIRESVFDHPEAAPFLTGGRSEISIFWFDEKYGIWLKCRPDYMTDDSVYVEFKTCPDARPGNFLRYIGHLNYHWHALYLDGLTAVTGYHHSEMRIIAAETSEPHAVNMFPIDTGTMEIGRLQYRALLKEYVEHLKTDTWPAYALNNAPLKFSRQALTVPEDVWENWIEY